MARKDEAWDDGRTIADMNADGMPWYAPKEERAPESGEQITPRQERFAVWGALKAGLLVVGVFSVALILFVLFCTHVWLR
ncbi:MAG: hypothetical protein ACOYI8_08905 [Christensenellales bacterium]|jgi:hypothetical protein